MKTASPELIALLNGSQQFVMADLLTITLNSGTVLRYTSADIDLVYGGNTFTSFRFKRGRTRIVIGVEVDSLDVTLLAGVDDLIAGVPYPHFAHNGGFDGAAVLLQRAFLSDWSAPVVGALWMFSGRVADVDPSRTQIRLEVKSDLELLNVGMPRNPYQPRCGYTLYDTGCAVSRAAFTAVSWSTTGSTRGQVLCGLAQSSGWFDRGTILFTTGANAGVMRTVKSYVPGVVVPVVPFPSVPEVGDFFEIVPGCDKPLETCDSKFSNKARFRGFPYVPVPETVY